MLSSVKDRLDRREDEGFTLIELMVVVLIIAILLAIAIPTFLGARGQANSRAAQSTLRNALTAEQTFYSQNQAFNDTSGSPSVTSIEPNLNWKIGTAVSPTMTEDPNTVYATVAYVTGANDTVTLQVFGKDGNCYTVFQSNGQVPSGNFGTGYAINKGACVQPSVTNASPGITYPTVTQNSASSNTVTTSAAPTAYYTKW